MFSIAPNVYTDPFFSGFLPNRRQTQELPTPHQNRRRSTHPVSKVPNRRQTEEPTHTPNRRVTVQSPECPKQTNIQRPHTSPVGTGKREFPNQQTNIQRPLTSPLGVKPQCPNQKVNTDLPTLPKGTVKQDCPNQKQVNISKCPVPSEGDLDKLHTTPKTVHQDSPNPDTHVKIGSSDNLTPIQENNTITPPAKEEEVSSDKDPMLGKCHQSHEDNHQVSISEEKFEKEKLAHIERIQQNAQNIYQKYKEVVTFFYKLDCSKLDSVHEKAFSPKFRMEVLQYEEELVGELLKLDSVDTLGMSSVREKRKNLVGLLQRMLKLADTIKQEVFPQLQLHT